MTIRKAHLVDAPALAWTAALAFAAETGREGLQGRAAARYLMYLAMLLPSILAGNVWHLDRQAVVSIAPRRSSAAVLAIGFALILAGYFAFRLWIPTAGLLALLIVEAVMVGLVLLGLAIVVPTLPELRKVRQRAANARAIQAWARSAPMAPVYTLSLLAKRPNVGTIGFDFATQAISDAIGPGGRVVIEARTEKHAKIYEAKGFYRLLDDGKSTLAMVATV